jgi:hypothetical protein
MGVNLGDVIAEGGTIYGDGANIAASIADEDSCRTNPEFHAGRETFAMEPRNQMTAT